MLRLLADENFHGDIVRGLLRHVPALDLVRVQDEGLSEADDETILEWAAAHDRVLLTHDRKTILRFAYQRVRLGMPMPGVFLVDAQMGLGPAIDELSLAIEGFETEECRDSVKYFPL